MLDINYKILVFSGFRTNQDLEQQAGVPLLYQIYGAANPETNAQGGM